MRNDKTADLSLSGQALLVRESAISRACECVCDCVAEERSGSKSKGRRKSAKRMLALYVTMVAVSTCAIYFLEHASLVNAFRTALVAAVGKTIAASWVSSLFD